MMIDIQSTTFFCQVVTHIVLIAFSILTRVNCVKNQQQKKKFIQLNNLSMHLLKVNIFPIKLCLNEYIFHPNV